ncbi:alpha/beta fold hydrolase [Streptomyces sp. NPDC050704]|uniref:thioesterase II family protein n=1 Tax=Streptomyces sp. NPDC050704 TaxID=3157219 RepID=UPI003448AC8A
MTPVVTARADTDTWFRRYRRTAAPRLRLVGFPHAGGTAQLFHGWPPLLPPDVELLAVRYPGRQDRLAEPCVESMDELADRIADALTDRLDLPLVFFGHSMGSSVAYEVAVRLEARHGTGPVRLLVSGRAAPHHAKRSGLHDTDDDTLIAGIRSLGDLGSEAFDIPELRELLLPPLRADYRLIETYRPAAPVPVRAPITAYVGTEDHGCVREDVLAWAELTTSGEFSLRAFDGDHFYLVPREGELLAELGRRLADVGGPAPAAKTHLTVPV